MLSPLYYTPMTKVFERKPKCCEEKYSACLKQKKLKQLYFDNELTILFQILGVHKVYFNQQ